MSRPAGRPAEGKTRAIPSMRPGERIPMHRQNIMHAETRPGYIRRTVNVTEDRIERLMIAGGCKAGFQIDRIADKNVSAIGYTNSTERTPP